jgi:orotidine-5'-phosphate decarboxylase
VAIQATRERGTPRVLFPTVPNPASFVERLTAKVAERQSQIVLGLDPDPMALWTGLRADDAPSVATSVAATPTEAGTDVGVGASGLAARAAAHVQAHCAALIDAAGPACVAVKPQLARFEALGAPGWQALEATVAHARQAGLLVIADAKRGDIDVTADAYAKALIGSTSTPDGRVQGLGADMVTVNPLMGADTIEPFVSVARQAGAGLLILVRTSNPGAADIEDLELAGGGSVWERIAQLVDRLGQEGAMESDGRARERTVERGRVAREGAAEHSGHGSVLSGMFDRSRPRQHLSDIGAVVGATAPEHLSRARELMPKAVFLLPGVGAQGGRVEDLEPAFAPGPAAGLVTASRSIAAAHETRGGAPAEAARAEAERLREQAWRLAEGS